MNIVFNAIVTHLIALKTLKSKKNWVLPPETKALFWTRQGFPLGFVQQVDDIPLEILLKGGD